MNNSENLPTDNNNKSIVKGQTMYNWETHDNQDKVIVDSINAIERRREHMTDEQLKKHIQNYRQDLVLIYTVSYVTARQVTIFRGDFITSHPTTCNYILFAAQSSAAATTASIS